MLQPQYKNNTQSVSNIIDKAMKKSPIFSYFFQYFAVIIWIISNDAYLGAR